MLAAYVRHASEPPLGRAERVEASGWTQHVAAEIAAASDLRVITHYEVAGEAVDIVVGEGDSAVALDTELHPAGVERHMQRHQALRRAGWTIHPFFRSSAHGREEEAIAELITHLRPPS